MVGKWPSGISSTGNFIGTLHKIEQEAQEIRDKTERNAFDIGSYTIGDKVNKQNGITCSSMEYDLQAILQADDLNKNGLRTYIYHANGEEGQEALQAFDRAMSTYKPVSPDSSGVTQFFDFKDNADTQTVITEDMRDLLSGKGGLENQNIVDVFRSVDTIQNSKIGFKDGEQWIFDVGGSSFSKEGYINDRRDFFKGLVGEGQ